MRLLFWPLREPRLFAAFGFVILILFSWTGVMNYLRRSSRVIIVDDIILVELNCNINLLLRL